MVFGLSVGAENRVEKETPCPIHVLEGISMLLLRHLSSQEMSGSHVKLILARRISCQVFCYEVPKFKNSFQRSSNKAIVKSYTNRTKAD